MKVLVLGAAGRSGKAVVSSLLGTRGVELILLADHNAEELTKMAAELRQHRAWPRFLDAESDSGLRARMSEADLVLGCLGPCHRHESRVVDAAISTRRDYISLCDDGDSVMQALSLDPDARKRGIRILCGCGMAPGLSNLLALRAGSRLDSVHALEISWYLETGGTLGAATMQHLLKAMHGKAVSYESGGVRKVLAGSGEEVVEFPPPIGWRAVSHIVHPEPLTLALVIGEASDICFKGGVEGRGKGLALQSLAWMGEMEGERSQLRETALQAIALSIVRRGKGASLSALRVTAAGEVGGVERRITRALIGDYYALTGRAMAAAVEHYMEGFPPEGIYPPEEFLNSRAFYGKLYKRGVRFLVGEEAGDEGAIASPGMTA